MTLPVEECRKRNVLAMIGEGRRFATDKEFAQAVGKSPQMLSQYLSENTKRLFGRRLARDIEKKLGLPELSLEEQPDSEKPVQVRVIRDEWQIEAVWHSEGWEKRIIRRRL